MPIKRKPSLRWGIFFTIRFQNRKHLISYQHTLCTLCIMVAGRIQNLDLYMSKIHIRNDNYMFDFIITAVLVLFPADNHGSPDPLRDSPERFPLGTSQASPGPISLRICAAFTLPRAKKWREGVGQTALSVPFSNVYLKKKENLGESIFHWKNGHPRPKKRKKELGIAPQLKVRNGRSNG